MDYFEMNFKRTNNDIRGYNLPKSTLVAKSLKANHTKYDSLDHTTIKSVNVNKKKL